MKIAMKIEDMIILAYMHGIEDVSGVLEFWRQKGVALSYKSTATVMSMMRGEGRLPRNKRGKRSVTKAEFGKLSKGETI